jgi:RHS repeat-associated protein
LIEPGIGLVQLDSQGHFWFQQRISHSPPTVAVVSRKCQDRILNPTPNDSARLIEPQTYAYDTLNRISLFEEKANSAAPACAPGGSTPCRAYGYDNWSNQFVSQANVVTRHSFTPAATSNFDAANRLIIQSSTYDPAGNQTGIGGYTFTYDAENSLKTSAIGGNTTTYAYDGEGRRVKKGNEIYVYDAFGNLAAEYGGTASSTGTRYLTTDHLGSTRVITKQDGTVDRRIDYLPFGESLPTGVSGRTTAMGYQGTGYLGPLKPGFTGKDRDAETGLDYFGARYMSAAQGRFTSADAPFADQFPENPQSWNLYSYVRNNPLRYIDEDGRGAKEFFFGLVNAVSSNAGATQRSRSSHPHVRMGQRLGDGLSIAGGFVEMAGGATITGTGAGACGTGVLCVAGAPAIVAGVSIAGHGAMMTGNALASLMSTSEEAPGSSGRSSNAEKSPELITNPKHHPNSSSPQPSNVQDLFKNSVADKRGVRWAKDADGTIHRFSTPSNGQSHWNGSTAGKKPIRLEDIPNEIRKQFQ